MKDFLGYKLFELDGYTLDVFKLISLLLFLVAIFILIIILKRIIYRSKSLDTAKKFAINKLTRYILLVLAFIVGVRILGFKLSVLLAGSAALMVGLGFGLQNLFNDFISGIILLLDGTLKVDDVIEVNGIIYKVQEINFRTTTVIGRDENYVILPNSTLTGNRIINWTHGKISSRFSISIGVDYSTDVPLLMQLLKEIAARHEKVLKNPEPFVRFEDYGDSSLLFSVYFYTEELFRVENIKSEIRVEIFHALKERGINIPFPQRDIHIKS
ncbi:mechanosensitive ion channel family protein [Microbacter margulisiae]|uniref:Small-conductance mechanosensitive channel n=1 Tax=Microbacter margulisiae TaxID=1350067 RepID=A0A7W5DTR0_9PORP|nr:mechanosensitive ion channel domain-containing protein [Microbacter margulisiae]MBB3188746.1 small-conductance mechanosensitive channel [Microbacter margulisiae]